MDKLVTKSKPSILQREQGLADLCESVLRLTQKHGATHADVAVSADQGLSTQVRLSDVETVEFNRDKGVGVSVYFGDQRGSASSSDTSSAALEAMVIAACDIAKVTAGDPCFGLADKSLVADSYPQLALYHPWDITAEDAIELAMSCEKKALDTDPRIINSEGTSVASYEMIRAYANTNGFSGHFAATRHSMSCVLIGQDEAGMQRNYDYTTARKAHQLLSADEVAATAVKRTLSRLNARKIKTQKAPVLFSPEVSGSLIGSFISAVSGGNLYRKSTFLVDKLGEKIFPQNYDIYESPHIQGGLGSSPFDNEGVVTRNNQFITQGILTSYVLGSYSARRLGLQTTANAGGVHNLTITHDDKDFDTLLKQMGTGLLVTELMGQGTHLITGDYSRGASGFWVENGEIQYPVEELTIAGNLKDMFLNIAAVGNDLDVRKSYRCGSILIESMSIAGQ